MLFRFGYQPGLDGLRAVSVIAVLLYHGGFPTFRGGFLGVEVFFVISGFLITSLLIEEHEIDGSISLRGFWTRRVKRLVPALVAVLVASSVWIAAFGDASEQSSFRRELPWSLLYANNWGQIIGDTPYFAEGPNMLRHLWSLAVEEQWYLLWPLLFVLLTRRARSPIRPRLGLVVAVAAMASVLHMVLVSRHTGAVIESPIGVFDGADRINFLYLSTTTRASGLLLGAAAAFVWRPWTRLEPHSDRVTRCLDVAALSALVVVVLSFGFVDLTELSLYRWLLPVVSICSLVLAATVTHPDSWFAKTFFSMPILVAIGQRSYGLYLWSWPISIIVGATNGSVVRFMTAMAITGVVSEASYRWIEVPLRRAHWAWPRTRLSTPRLTAGAFSIAGVVVLTAFYVRVDTFDRFRGNDVATFDEAAADSATASTAEAPSTSIVTGSTATDQARPSDTVASNPSSTTSSTLPPAVETTRLAIVGDSTANALAVNQPNGIGSIYPVIVNRSTDGCSVFDSGRILTTAAFGNDFTRCTGWQESWGRAAAEADVVLVVIGAWDVFDIQDGNVTYAFGTIEGDRHFTDNLRSGIDAVIAGGARVGLLEVPCMRPVESSGSSLPPLPERGDDRRVEHVNRLMRRVADQYGPAVAFIDGADAWCNDPAIANDTRLRWDGVHVYGEGANLTYEATAPSILQLAAMPL